MWKIYKLTKMFACLFADLLKEVLFALTGVLWMWCLWCNDVLEVFPRCPQSPRGFPSYFPFLNELLRMDPLFFSLEKYIEPKKEIGRGSNAFPRFIFKLHVLSKTQDSFVFYPDPLEKQSLCMHTFSLRVSCICEVGGADSGEGGGKLPWRVASRVLT